jgi:hypothetical protein
LATPEPVVVDEPPELAVLVAALAPLVELPPVEAGADEAELELLPPHPVIRAPAAATITTSRHSLLGCGIVLLRRTVVIASSCRSGQSPSPRLRVPVSLVSGVDVVSIGLGSIWSHAN